jgi:hypothetical protein
MASNFPHCWQNLCSVLLSSDSDTDSAWMCVVHVRFLMQYVLPPVSSTLQPRTCGKKKTTAHGVKGGTS